MTICISSLWQSSNYPARSAVILPLAGLYPLAAFGSRGLLFQGGSRKKKKTTTKKEKQTKVREWLGLHLRDRGRRRRPREQRRRQQHLGVVQGHLKDLIWLDNNPLVRMTERSLLFLARPFGLFGGAQASKKEKKAGNTKRIRIWDNMSLINQVC